MSIALLVIAFCSQVFAADGEWETRLVNPDLDPSAFAYGLCVNGRVDEQLFVCHQWPFRWSGTAYCVRVVKPDGTLITTFNGPFQAPWSGLLILRAAFWSAMNKAYTSLALYLIVVYNNMSS